MSKTEKLGGIGRVYKTLVIKRDISFDNTDVDISRVNSLLRQAVAVRANQIGMAGAVEIIKDPRANRYSFKDAVGEVWVLYRETQGQQ